MNKIVPRAALVSSRSLGAVAEVPEGTVSTKTGLPVSGRPLPRHHSEYVYEDKVDVPIPTVPFVENPTPEQKKILELQNKSWTEISNEDKYKIYKMKFQWSIDDLGHIQQTNNFNIFSYVMIFTAIGLLSYELLGLYLWDRTRRPIMFTEPRMSPFRAKIKKFMNKVNDVVNPQYLDLKENEQEIEGVEIWTKWSDDEWITFYCYFTIKTSLAL